MSEPPETRTVTHRILYVWLAAATVVLVALLIWQFRAPSTSERLAQPSPTSAQEPILLPSPTAVPTSAPSVPPASATPAPGVTPPPTREPPTPSPMPATDTPTPPTPPPSATPEPGCAVSGDARTLRAGPATWQRPVLRLEPGERVLPLARSADGDWVQVVTYDGIEGWVPPAGLSCPRNQLNVLPVIVAPAALPTPEPTSTSLPTPLPAAPVISDWRGEYYAGTNLGGAPLVVRNDPVISFDWGAGSPDPRMSADNFSARWARAWRFEAGTYRFRLSVDDGARLYVDDGLVLDMWTGGTLRTQTVDLNLAAGEHTLRVEYFEAAGFAAAYFSWENVTAFGGWRGEYYANQNLSGSPLILRDDPNLSFDWGQGAPEARLPADYFSARWRRELDFAAGTYRFRLRADDGVRLWVDDAFIMDEWHPANTTYQRDINLSAGRHTLRVEYVEFTGNAIVALEWTRIEDFPDWRGEYYNNEALQGAPVVVRNDARVDFIWGNGVPVAGINADYFGVRWNGRPNLAAGVYRFQIIVDDGARLWVNGVLVIDVWDRPGTWTATMSIPYSGPQDMRLEYHEAAGWAQIRLSWERIA